MLLSHRDDVADADQWADRYNARVRIHVADGDAAPYATDVTTGDADIAAGVRSLHTQGHTEGHVVYHIDDRWLFTGDTLFWNHRTDQLDVTPKQTWHSWDVLANSTDHIADLNVEWVFPGHGKWHNIGIPTYQAQMKALGSDMRHTGQEEWAKHPYTVFSWY